MTETATWVYAITPVTDADVTGALEGIGGGRVREVVAGELAAAASSVDAAAYSEREFQRRLADPAELEALARAHHRVIGALAAAGPVLPLRLGTVYRADDRARAMLAQRREELTRTLRWLAGRAEYGVKVWVSPGAAAVTAEPAVAPEPGRGRGAAYLARRRDELAARDQDWQRATEAGADIHELLSELAWAARRHQPQQGAGEAGQRDVMVLNGAYLVADPAGFAAAARAAADARPGIRLEVTGPWPPYSFADGPQEPA